MISWLFLTLSPIVVGMLARRFTGHLRLALVAIAALALLLIGFTDALIADRYGEDLFTMWTLLAFLVGGTVLTRRDAPLLQLSLLFLSTALALALAYLLGGAATGVGWACWQSCDATTRIDELVVASFGLGVLLLILWIAWMGLRAVFSRMVRRSSVQG